MPPEEYYRLCVPGTKEYPNPVLERPCIETELADPDEYLCSIRLEVNWALSHSWTDREKRDFAHIEMHHVFEGEPTDDGCIVVSYKLLPELIRALQEIKNKMDRELHQEGNI